MPGRRFAFGGIFGGNAPAIRRSTPMPLKELERAKDYKLADGERLYPLVRANGSKLWRMKYRFAHCHGRGASFGRVRTAAALRAATIPRAPDCQAPLPPPRKEQPESEIRPFGFRPCRHGLINANQIRIMIAAKN